VSLNKGKKGEWSNVRPRKEKAHEQEDRQRDRLREDRRHGGARERRKGLSRVRSRYGSAIRYYSEEESDYGYQELGQDGRVIVQFEQTVRVRDRDALTYEDAHVLQLRQPPHLCEKIVVARLTDGRVQQQQKRPRSDSSLSAASQRDQQITVNSKLFHFILRMCRMIFHIFI